MFEILSETHVCPDCTAHTTLIPNTEKKNFVISALRNKSPKGTSIPSEIDDQTEITINVVKTVGTFSYMETAVTSWQAFVLNLRYSPEKYGNFRYRGYYPNRPTIFLKNISIALYIYLVGSTSLRKLFT